MEPEEDGGRDGGRLDLRCGSEEGFMSGEPRGSGALVTRPVSLIARRGLPFAADTVCALDIFGWFVGSAKAVSSMGCGFRAWAIAMGPATLARLGTPILAITKLASIVTGITFSLIFSWRAASPRPKTMF